MARKEKEYARLPGQSRPAFAVSGMSRCSMWAAKDHLLYVENEGYSESYRRFYYRDIQAILVRKTVTGTVITAVLAAITALTTLWLTHAVSMGWRPEGIVPPAIGAAFFLILLAGNILKGPTCAAYIRTAVQTERIRSLRRLRTALKLIGRVRGAIEEAQGGTFTEELVERMNGEVVRLEEEAARRAAVVEAARGKKKAGSLKPYRGRIHELLFALLLADFCHNCLQFQVADPNMFLVALALGIGILVSVVIALLRQYDTNLWTGIKVATWAVVPYLIVAGLATNICFTFSSLQHGGAQAHSWRVYRAMYATSPFDSWLRMTMVIIGTVGSGSLGLAGLLMINRFKRGAADAGAQQEPVVEQESPT